MRIINPAVAPADICKKPIRAEAEPAISRNGNIAPAMLLGLKIPIPNITTVIGTMIAVQ